MGKIKIMMDNNDKDRIDEIGKEIKLDKIDKDRQIQLKKAGGQIDK